MSRRSNPQGLPSPNTDYGQSYPFAKREVAMATVECDAGLVLDPAQAGARRANDGMTTKKGNGGTGQCDRHKKQIEIEDDVNPWCGKGQTGERVGWTCRIGLEIQEDLFRGWQLRNRG